MEARSPRPPSWPASPRWRPGSRCQPGGVSSHLKTEAESWCVSLRTGRAVRCVLERGEDMLITGGRHPVLGRYKVLQPIGPRLELQARGVLMGGLFLLALFRWVSGMTERSWLQISSSTPTLATPWMNPSGWVEAPLAAPGLPARRAQQSSLLFLVQVVEKILLLLDNIYDIPNLRGRAAACRTNLPSNTAFRGFGVPQGLLVLENMINDVAMVLGRPADQV